MRQRSKNWFSLEAAGASIAGSAASEPDAAVTGASARAASYRFSHGAMSVARSHDGWFRLRLAVGEVTDQRRSWAVDAELAGSRQWSPLTIGCPAWDQPATTTRVQSFDTGGVEGAANPPEDTRGQVTETAACLSLWLPLHGRAATAEGGQGVDARASPDAVDGLQLRVARCRDGLRIELTLCPAARIYGLGEKTGGLDKRGRTWAFWNTDDPLQIPTRDPLYQSIPVAYVFEPATTLTVFSDSPATQYFDLCESDPNCLRIEVYDAQVDLYLRRDKSLPAAVAAYTGLTGRLPLPPEWAIGFQQCRYSYVSEARVMEIADRLRSERIPCDVIYFDIHYMDGYRVFTWDPTRFSDPARLLRALHERGFHVVTIIDPGVKADPNYSVYADGVRRGVFLDRHDGRPYLGRVWPGDAAFPDFSDQAARSWWAEQHEALMAVGVDGIWNDMNEPSDFAGDPIYRPGFTVPDDLVASNDGLPVGFGRVHNAYANGMNQATRRALDRHQPNRRGFVLTRAGYAGIQRHAAVWTGDNHSWWEHLAAMIPMQLNLGLSGVAFCGADTGGFQLNATPELFARWVAAACLMPFFRAHSALDTLDHEPWSFGTEVLDAVRAHIELRYQLLPYLYGLFEESARTGAPILRPLVWDYPDDARVADRSDSFLLGPSLLVAPVRERGVQERSVYLPRGCWYDFWTAERHAGGSAVVVPAPIGRLPLFVRAGSIIPYEAVRQHTGEPGDGVLRLLVASAAGGSSSDALRPNAQGMLYADRGEGYGYRSNEFWRALLNLEGDRVIVRTVAGQGPMISRWQNVTASTAGAGLPVDRGQLVPLDPEGAEVICPWP